MSSPLSTPWTPVKPPEVVRKRLERAALDDDASTSSIIEIGPSHARTSGSKLRERMDHLREKYDTEALRVGLWMSECGSRLRV